MSLRCIPKIEDINSNSETETFWVDTCASFRYRVLQSLARQVYNNTSAQVFISGDSQNHTNLFIKTLAKSYDMFVFRDYAFSNKDQIWIMSKQDNCHLSLGIPLIFSVSQDAENMLSEDKGLEKDVGKISNMIADFAMDNHLNAIGELSVFHEDGAQPKLFITYGIDNKSYNEILTLWDDACRKLAEKVPVESLKKVAVVFDQL